jgi:hypothetical protein
MAKWRAEALKRLPELRHTIDEAWEIMALWLQIQSAFAKAYKSDPPNDSLISRIYDFADWCLDAPRGPDAGHDPMTSVCVAFYEDIPTIKVARDDMPRWFRYEDIVENKQIFSYQIGESEYEKLVEYMRRNQRRYVPRDHVRSS